MCVLDSAFQASGSLSVQDPKENANINTYIIKSSEKWHGRSSNDDSVGSRW